MKLINGYGKRLKDFAVRSWRAVHPNGAAILAIIAGTAFAIALDDQSCLLRRTIGIPCPGCGMTRATFALLRLDFAAAFTFHPLVYIIVPFIIVLSVLLLTKRTTFKKSTPYIIAIMACMVIVYIIRMILFYPDAEPMTYDNGSLAAALVRFIRSVSERLSADQA
ncbi:MAG: DUF2752 domain-containing protein [Saccharofermentanales bacterium]